MYVEITSEAFYSICPSHVECEKTANTEHASKRYWTYKGVGLMTIYNFLSGTTQYFVADINS